MTLVSTTEPYLLGTIDIREAGPHCKSLLGDLNGDGRMELLLVQPDNRQDVRYIPHQVQCLTAYDLEGNLLWQTGKPNHGAGRAGSDYPAQIADIDGDGRLEVLCVMEGQFLILNGHDGSIRSVHELPDPHAHDCIIVANLTGGAHAGDIILKDRYHRLWALDGEFKLLWTHEGNPGHFPWVYDLDGDGHDEVMAGYDLLDHDGKLLWSCRDLDDHADCIWIGDVNGDGEPELVIGGSVTVMYDRHGKELWRYEGSVESQHIALGRFRADLPGLQIAGLDRLVREDDGKGLVGKDALFLLDSEGRELWKEDRKTPGWLTIIEPLRGWAEDAPDYILAYRRGGGVFPTLYDGDMNAVVEFPSEGYAVHADLWGSGTEQVIIYSNDTASIYSSKQAKLSECAAGSSLPQPKRLSSSTLYPGGEIK
ncbi:FG-GAP-like repeat-containing protein [Paenibacillus glycanilyticus]|uniref:FG-GAP-like repeat-containing protein n=1 Tax=Paenibacillus glycanilyticus TaxID=126569 RepID=UPI00203E324A|nr:FG-GAP-like repeat-containing protein [Paenibacillus glycanilyticus]MCM3626618.1 FG-GAP-like repeat-containing protein [Paenibacillus glycanilyticus]